MHCTGFLAESLVEIGDIQPKYIQVFQNLCRTETGNHQQREKRHVTHMQDVEEQ